MLRASIESSGVSSGTEVDLSGIAPGSDASGSPVRGASVLIDFVDATVAALAHSERARTGASGVREREPDFEEATETAKKAAVEEAMKSARDAVREALGEAALVDAAAIIGNFERMVRIADGTGIPLDTPIRIATESIQAELGIDRFEAAARANPVKTWQRGLRRALEPIVTFVLRRRARRSDL